MERIPALPRHASSGVVTAAIGVAAMAALGGGIWNLVWGAAVVNVAVAYALGMAGWRYGEMAIPAVLVTGLVGGSWLGGQSWPGSVIESAVAGGVLVLLAGWAGRQAHRLASQVARLARTDPLTELFNQLAFAELLEAELNRSARRQAPLAVAVLDGDGFKEINDRQGHLVGDRYLRESARVIRAAVRRYDVVARWGGDEFTILFPECGAVAASAAVMRVQERLHELARTEGCDVTWSIGVVVVRGGGAAEAILEAADQMMYEAKRTAPGSVMVRDLEPNTDGEMAPPGGDLG